MRDYALTYPQLMNQAMAWGLEEADLTRLRETYDFMEAMVDGLYRAQGVPFACHLVRCASVVLAERLPLAVVQAAMVHAAYRLDLFRGSRRRPTLGSSRRNELRRALGPEVEAVIARYERLTWYRVADIQKYVEQFEAYGEPTRQVLVIRLADELDDWLDGGLAYCDRQCVDNRMVGYGPDCIELARRLGREDLASDLTEAMQQGRRALPDGLVRGSELGYERPRRHRWEMTLPERALLWGWRRGKRLVLGRRC